MSIKLMNNSIKLLSLVLMSSACAYGAPSYEDCIPEGIDIVKKVKIKGSLKRVVDHKAVIGANSVKHKGHGVKVFVFDSAYDPYSDVKNMSESFMATLPAEGSPEALKRRAAAQGKGHNHANHVTSTIAGPEGIAPEAEVHVIDFKHDPALKDAITYDDKFVAAIDKVIASKKREQALFEQNTDETKEFNSHTFVNISMRLTHGDAAISERVQKALLTAALQHGIGFVKSGGNDGETTGDTPYTRSLAELLVKMNGGMRIAVSSKYGKNGREVISNFSNKAGIAKEFTLTAPGEDILAHGANNEPVPMSGTSMAAPSVTGAAANLASANPQLTTAEVFSLMDRTARKESLDGQQLDENQYGHGVIQVKDANARGKKERDMFFSLPMDEEQDLTNLQADEDGIYEIPYEEPAPVVKLKEEPKKVAAPAAKKVVATEPAQKAAPKSIAAKAVGVVKTIASAGVNVAKTAYYVASSAVKAAGSWFGY
ncbi:MAG TPA: S8 family serine peptidase [Alphaproteobacteria bacterium]|nr:S8 family serine peptidase [Alphaproteobacteria bacterium]